MNPIVGDVVHAIVVKVKNENATVITVNGLRYILDLQNGK